MFLALKNNKQTSSSEMVGRMNKLLLPDRTNSDPIVKLAKFSPRSIRLGISRSDKPLRTHSYSLRKINRLSSKLDKVAVVNLGYRCDSIDYQWDLICKKDADRKSAGSGSVSISSKQTDQSGYLTGGDECSPSASDELDTSGNFRRLNCNAILGLEVLTHSQFHSLATGNTLRFLRSNSGVSDHLLPSLLISFDKTGDEKKSGMIRRDYGEVKKKHACSCLMSRGCQRVGKESREPEVLLVDLTQDEEDSEQGEVKYDWNIQVEDDENVSEKHSDGIESALSDKETMASSLATMEKELVSLNEGQNNEKEETVRFSDRISVGDDRRMSPTCDEKFTEGSFLETASNPGLLEGHVEEGDVLTPSTGIELEYCTNRDEIAGGVPSTLPTNWIEIDEENTTDYQTPVAQNGSFLTAPDVEHVTSDLKRKTWNAENSSRFISCYTRADYLWDCWISSSSLLGRDAISQGHESSANVSNESHPKGLRRSLRRCRSVDRLNYYRESPKRPWSRLRHKGCKAKKRSRDDDVHRTKCTACNGADETYHYRKSRSVSTEGTRKRKKPPAKKSSRRIDGYTSEYASCNEESADDVVDSCVTSRGYSSCDEDATGGLVHRRSEESSEPVVESPDSTERGERVPNHEVAFTDNDESSSLTFSRKRNRKAIESSCHKGGYYSDYNGEFELWLEKSKRHDKPLKAWRYSDGQSNHKKPLRKCRANSLVNYSEDSEVV